MSDHHAAPDPVDKVYAQAEAMLDDEAARAARRARVLGAVAGEAGKAPIRSAPPKRRVSWAAGGWLAAASLAGVSALLTFHFMTPPVKQRASSPAETSVAAPPAPTPPTMPAVDAPPPPAAAASQAPIKPSTDVAVAASEAVSERPSQPAVAPVAAPPPAPPPALRIAPDVGVEGLVMHRAEAPAADRGMAAAAPMAQAQAPASPTDRTARLHAAATAGDLAELANLLAEGTPVDAPDSEGETALMKSIQANRPAAAALLRRHGASLDRTNRAGISARDMATSIDDPQLNRALGLNP